jgi:hypothetical protein
MPRLAILRTPHALVKRKRVLIRRFLMRRTQSMFPPALLVVQRVMGPHPASEKSPVEDRYHEEPNLKHGAFVSRAYLRKGWAKGMDRLKYSLRLLALASTTVCAIFLLDHVLNLFFGYNYKYHRFAPGLSLYQCRFTARRLLHRADRRDKPASLAQKFFPRNSLSSSSRKLASRISISSNNCAVLSWLRKSRAAVVSPAPSS